MELDGVNKALTCVIHEVAKDQMITRLKEKNEKLEEKIDYMLIYISDQFSICKSCEKLIHDNDNKCIKCYDCDEIYCYDCMESKEFELGHLLICSKCKKNECRHLSICPKCNKKTFETRRYWTHSCHICYPWGPKKYIYSSIVCL
jgi:hypothetical protein